MTWNIERVSKRLPCQICGRPDWCTYTETVAFCMRISVGSFRTSRNGYMHRTEVQRQNTQHHFRARSGGQVLRASDEHVDRVYTALLQMLSISAKHRDDLRRRGLDDACIDDRVYRSAPTEDEAKTIITALEPLGLERVPGLYRIGTSWHLVKIPSGILVSVCNHEGLITGIQVRLNNISRGSKYIWLSSAHQNGGSSSGAPIHWSNPELLGRATEVLLTEGALKADIISYYLGVTVIAAAGVGLFGKEFGVTLKLRCPDITAIICFDSDWQSKPQVETALISLQKQLTAARLEWKVRCWSNEYKGYDDYLLALRVKETA